MRIKLLIILVLVAPAIRSTAQNLVPNGGFETYSTCPDLPGQVDLATGWFILTQATPDYFNACDTNNNVGVPLSVFGTQAAHSGDAYAGIILAHFTFNNTREYIEIAFDSALVANETYCFQMFVSLGEWSRYTASNIGAYFSQNPAVG